MPNPTLLARHGDVRADLFPAMGNRHGLITGATGTGKTVTLQVLTEAFSRMGTAVFLADIKGDLTGLAQAGQSSPKLQARLTDLGLSEPVFAAFPVTRWDVFGADGHPVRATVAAMGPVLLARMLDLNDTQSGVLALVFRVAQDDGQALVDLDDLRAMLADVAARSASLQTRYGNVSSASVGAIQRALLTLESQGAQAFFGEPMLDVADLMTVDPQGLGRIGVLAADKLVAAPKLYAVFLLWLLSALFDRLPEAGDLPQPKLVFFFDEAHLLFKDAPTALLEKVEQVVRLIRSKGVGVWFVTQNPGDVPDTVLGQLGNRVQHALRAYTPRDEQALRVAARTMRPNPGLNIEQAMSELATGEALISLLDQRGRPSPTVRAWIVPPASRIGPADPDVLQHLAAASSFALKYDHAVNRHSAADALGASERAGSLGREGRLAPGASEKAQTGAAKPAGGRVPRQAPAPSEPAALGWWASVKEVLFGTVGPRGGRRDGLAQLAVKTGTRSVISGVTRALTQAMKSKRRR